MPRRKTIAVEELHEFDMPSMYGMGQKPSRGRPRKYKEYFCNTCAVMEIDPYCTCPPKKQKEKGCQCWSDE